MAINPEELFGDAVSQTPLLRAYPYQGGIIVGKLGALSGAPELPNLTPLAFDEDADEWTVFDDSTVNETYTLTADATPASAGSFTLTVDGATTAAIAFDAAAAAVLAALEALPNLSPGDVTVVASGSGTDLGDAGHVLTIAFVGPLAGEVVVLTADQTGISSGNDFALANSLNGSGGAANQVDGLLWKPDADGQATHATDETLVQVLIKGQVHHDDIPVPTTSSQTQGGLTAALKAQRVRMLGLDIVGVQGVH